MIIRGPFNLEWGGNVLAEISEIDIEVNRVTESYVNNSGVIYEIQKGMGISAIITLLATDVASLSAVLPQYFVGNGESLSNGEVVSHAEGSLEIPTGDCDGGEIIYNDLSISSCGGDQDILVIPQARTVFEGIQIDKIRKVRVKFIAEGDAIMRLVKDNLLLLDDGDLFALDNGEGLIL